MNIFWRMAHKLYGGVRLLYPLGRFFELINYVLFSNSVSAKACIGKGTKFWHRALGCVVHPKCTIGENCNIFQNVTLGSKWSKNLCEGGAPTIGNNVMIGAGAVVLGNIKIGNNVIIGANSVILHDIPDNCTVVGINKII